MIRHLCLVTTILFAAAACGSETQTPTQAEPSAEAQTPPAQPESDDATREALAKPPTPVEMATLKANARRGRILFITNGCVICHQVNGVGGVAAPALDGPPTTSPVNPLEFSASMWRGALAMTALQSLELGYVIDLEAQDIADLAAFASSEDERALLTLDSVPADMQDWFLNEPYWKTQSWEEYLKRGERIPFDDDL